MTDDLEQVALPERVDDVNQLHLVDVPPAWRDAWWGMPSFEMRDARPVQTIAVSFATWDDVLDFAARLNLRIGRTTRSVWYPEDSPMSSASVDKPALWSYEDE